MHPVIRSRYIRASLMPARVAVNSEALALPNSKIPGVGNWVVDKDVGAAVIGRDKAATLSQLTALWDQP